MATVFEQILDTNAIEVDDDGSLAKLLAAAGDVEKLIRNSKLSPAAAVLVAMDSGISDDEPLLEEVQAAVKKHWPTLRRRHVETPVALLRAVLTEGLSRAAKDDEIGSVIWLTAASYAPYAPTTAESQIWTGLLRAWGTKAQSAAATTWAPPSATPPDEARAKLPVPSFAAKRVSTDWLASRLEAAVGPVDSPPEGVTANANYIVANYRSEKVNQPWGAAFGKSAASAISEGVLAATEASLKSGNFDPLITAIEGQLQAVGRSVSESLSPVHAVELRSRVLLWDRAHYSDRLECGYRELAPELAALAMAADLAAIVPAMSPRSIDSLLWESVRDVVGEVILPFGQLAEVLAGRGLEVGAVLGTGAVPEGNQRGTLLQFLRRVVANPGAIDQIRRSVGVERHGEVHLTDLARWIFRDIRAESIAPRTRKRR